MTRFFKRLEAARYSVVIPSAVAMCIGIIVVLSPYLSLILAAGILVIMLASSGLSIPLIILTIPIRGLSFGAIGGGYIRVGDLIIGLLILFYFLRDPARRLFKSVVTNPLDLLVVLFVAFNVFSIVWAYDQQIALLGSSKLIRNLALYLLLRHEFLRNLNRATIFFIGAVILSTWVIIVDMSYWIWSTGGVEALLRMGVDMPLTSGSSELEVVRAFASGHTKLYEGPGNWFLLCIFIVGGWWIGQKTRSFLLRSCYSITVFFALAMVLILLQRGIIIGMVAGITVGMFFLSKFKYLLLRQIAIPILLPFLFLIIFLNPSHLIEQRVISMGSDISISIRLELWEDAFNNWMRSPLVGVGVGNSISIEKIPYLGGLTHNIYLGVLSELGIIGFGLFITLLVTWAIRVSKTIKLFRQRSLTKELFFAVGIFSGMTAYLVAGLTGQDGFYSMEPWLYLAITSVITSKGLYRNGGKASGLEHLCRILQ